LRQIHFKPEHLLRLFCRRFFVKTRTYSPTPANLRRLAGALQRSELVAIPTETVYGLAANALNESACRKIFKAKGRPSHDPLIVHVLDLAHAEELAEFNDIARRLVRKFWPGPLTIVLSKKNSVPAIVTAGRDTVAIRSPAHAVTRRLLELAGIPLAAPSANLFGYVSPTSAGHVRDGLNGKIPSILDCGPCTIGVESTIVDLSDPASPKILRPGAVTAEELEKALGKKIVRGSAQRGKRAEKTGLIAPGTLPQHYSPRTPLVIKHSFANPPVGTGEIFLRKPAGRRGANVYWLSRRASLAEIARNLYRVLRQADQGGHVRLWIEALSEDSCGLAAAINDRVRRAAAKRP
jgi:L-threonylcarbamoyladenylate synthase